jgi:hypothetical protein
VDDSLLNFPCNPPASETPAFHIHIRRTQPPTPSASSGEKDSAPFSTFVETNLNIFFNMPEEEEDREKRLPATATLDLQNQIPKAPLSPYELRIRRQ